MWQKKKKIGECGILSYHLSPLPPSQPPPHTCTYALACKKKNNTYTLQVLQFQIFKFFRYHIFTPLNVHLFLSLWKILCMALVQLLIYVSKNKNSFWHFFVVGYLLTLQFIKYNFCRLLIKNLAHYSNI